MKYREIVSVQWLNENLDNPNLVILDASMKANANGKDFPKYDSTIPFARKFDIKEKFSDKSSPFPNTVPKPEEFEKECRKMGINNTSEIVVFDNNGVYSSPRVWWLFNVMGHENIAVLDGGYPDWLRNGFPTTPNHQEQYEPGNFNAQYNKHLIVHFEDVKGNVKDEKFVIVDARSEGRFNGTECEPRKYLKSGKIENSVNIPYQNVLRNGKFKSKEELNELFKTKLNGETELVFSCGSGLTACIIMLACQIAFSNSKKVYDGSWTEWAELNNLKSPV